MNDGSLLAPLAARYGYWLGLDAAQVAADRVEVEADVRAMPLVLRMERETPPVWSAALVASCRAATGLCLDERAVPGGEWHNAVAEYVGAHIRKVTRRARAGHWLAVADLPGVAVSIGSTEVRALLPGPVADLDKRVSRLQVGGTDVPPDLEPGPVVLPEPGVLQLYVPGQLPMTTGKLMAQTGHAGMIAAALLAGADPEALRRWHDAGLPIAVARVAATDWTGLVAAAGPASGWEHRLVAVRDAGFTEIDPGTITVVADASTL